MPSLTITITDASGEEGYMYDIYNCEAEDINDEIDSLDGGCCTGSLEDALEMATSQAKEIIRTLNKS